MSSRFRRNSVFHLPHATLYIWFQLGFGDMTCDMFNQFSVNLILNSYIKTDIKRIRKTTEQEVVNALIRYHERRIAESKKSIKRQKRPTGTVNKKSKDNKNEHS